MLRSLKILQETRTNVVMVVTMSGTLLVGANILLGLATVIVTN